MRFDPQAPRDPACDRFVLSKGHAAPLLYAAWAAAGALDRKDLVQLRQIDSDLEGHPTPRLPFVDVATGSLGQGLGVGVGLALGARMLGMDARVFVLLDDGEMAEDSVWEAAQMASHEKLEDLVAVVDVNALGQSGPTMLGHDLKAYQRRLAAFGWRVNVIDGHDMKQVTTALRRATRGRGAPTAIVARTVKGKGLGPEVEGKEGWHGKPLPADMAERVIASLERGLHHVPPPPIRRPRRRPGTTVLPPPQPIGGKPPVGEDGPSQMALEDLALFRAIPEGVVFYPSDGVATDAAVQLAAARKGIVYIRTTRGKTPGLYSADEAFAVGALKTLRRTDGDRLAIIAAGITLHEAIAAHAELAKTGVAVRVIDLFCVKPVDAAALLEAARACDNRILTVEDHYPEGGIGDAVMEAVGTAGVAVHRLAVREIPRSGPPRQLLERFGIGRSPILAKVREILGG